MEYSYLFNDIHLVAKNPFKNSITLRLKDIFDQKMDSISVQQFCLFKLQSNDYTICVCTL